MPNIKSQKDRVVQAAAERAHNKAIKTNLKTVVKKANAAIDAKAADKDATVLAAVSAIDKARAKGVLKKNTASRKISRHGQARQQGRLKPFTTGSIRLTSKALRAIHPAGGLLLLRDPGPAPAGRRGQGVRHWGSQTQPSA